jgi:hypothetical protein
MIRKAKRRGQPRTANVDRQVGNESRPIVARPDFGLPVHTAPMGHRKELKRIKRRT